MLSRPIPPELKGFAVACLTMLALAAAGWILYTFQIAGFLALLGTVFFCMVWLASTLEFMDPGDGD